MRFAMTFLLMLVWSPGSEPAMESPPDSAEPANNAIKGLIGSAHDFTGPPWNLNNACSACHTPHIQAIRPTTQPASSQPAVDIYKMPGQRRVYEANQYTPGPTSLVCIGCHDGTVATSTIGSAHALLGGVRDGFPSDDELGLRDHPIGVTYPKSGREYRPLSYVIKQGIRLPEGRIECISCHEPHHEKGIDKMLPMSNRRSALCLSCHVK